MQRVAVALVGVVAIALLAFAPQSAALRINRLLAPVTRCPGQRDAAADVATQEAAMRCMHAYARRHARRGRLGSSAKLSDSAAAKARDILRCDQFSHVACGHDFLYWFEQLDFGLDGCWSAGENIAWASAGFASPRSVMRSWLRSPGHRSNILNRSFEQLGVGLRIGDLAGVDGAHVWVTHFGSHC
jgi:uncharacterized protein YkwD